MLLDTPQKIKTPIKGVQIFTVGVVWVEGCLFFRPGLFQEIDKVFVYVPSKLQGCVSFFIGNNVINSLASALYLGSPYTGS